MCNTAHVLVITFLQCFDTIGWVIEFQAEPQNLPVATKFLHFHGILQNLLKQQVINVFADTMT